MSAANNYSAASANWYTNSNCDFDAYTNWQANSFSYSYSNGNCNSNCDTNANSNSNWNNYSKCYTDRNSYTYSYANFLRRYLYEQLEWIAAREWGMSI